MIKIQTALLAVALSTPFGLAIHDDLTREPLDPERLGALAWVADDQLAFDGDVNRDEFYSVEGLGQALEAQGRLADEPDDTDQPDEPERPELTAERLRRLVGTQRATLGPALAPLRFGMTADQAGEAVPRIKNWAAPGDELAGVVVLLEYLGKGETQLTAVKLEFRKNKDWARAALEMLWGRPQAQAAGADLWIDEDAGLRAVLRAEGDYVSIAFSQVLTLEQLLGKPGDKGILGFAPGKRVLGARIADLGALRDAVWVDPYYGEYAVLELPGVIVDPAARSTTKIMMNLDKGKVSSVELAFGCGQRCQEVHDVLRSRHGEPRATDQGAMVYGSSPGLEVRTTGQGQGQDGAIVLSASLTR
jgi:hypothetical protein